MSAAPTESQIEAARLLIEMLTEDGEPVDPKLHALAALSADLYPLAEHTAEERARVDAIEAAEPAPESWEMRYRVAVAMSNAACDPAFLDIRWDYIPGPIKDAFWPALADAALSVIWGER